jgi:WD40 repeat protein
MRALFALCTIGLVCAIVSFIFRNHPHESQEAFIEQSVLTYRAGDWDITNLGADVQSTYYWEAAARLLIVTSNNKAHLWNTLSGTYLATISLGDRRVEYATISLDNNTILTAEEVGYPLTAFDEGSRVRNLALWNAETGVLLRRLTVDLVAVGAPKCTDWRFHWLDDNSVLMQCNHRFGITRASTKTLLGVMDTRTGTIVARPKLLNIGERLILSTDRTKALALNDYGVGRGRTGGVYAGGLGVAYEIELLTLRPVTEIATLRMSSPVPGGEQHAFLHEVWSPDGSTIATVGSNNSIQIWDGETGSLRTTMTGHREWILDAKFSNDGIRLVTASDDDTARVWDLRTGQLIAELKGHTAGLNVCVFDPTGSRVLTGAEDNTARIWNATTGKLLQTFAPHDSGVRVVAFLNNESAVRTTTVGGTAKVWSTENGQCLRECYCRASTQGWYGSCAVRRLRNGGQVWVPRVTSDRESVVPRSPNRPAPAILLGHKGGVTSTVFVGAKGLLASGGRDGRIILWDVDRWNAITGEGRKTVRIGPDTVLCVAASNDGATLVAGCEEGSLYFWDVNCGKLTGHIKTACHKIRALAFADDGKRLAAAGDGGVFSSIHIHTPNMDDAAVRWIRLPVFNTLRMEDCWL